MFTDMVSFDELSELRKAGKELGIGSFVILKEFKGIEELKKFRDAAKSYRIFKTCLLLKKADQKTIQKFFKKTDFIAVRGGSVSLNKSAASNRMVDFLVAPCALEKASIDTAIVRAAEENNVSIVVPCNDFAKASPFQQSQLFKHYLLTAKLCKRFKVKCLVFSLAKNRHELTTPRELIELGKALGFSGEQLALWHSGL